MDNEYDFDITRLERKITRIKATDLDDAIAIANRKFKGWESVQFVIPGPGELAQNQ